MLAPPPRNGKPIPAFELHAERDIHLAAQAGGGPITIGPARFRGDGGSLELYGESRGDKLQATVRGRIELGALGPLLSPWLARVSGSVDVDLVARPGDGPGGVNVSGKIGVAGPIGFRLASLPVDGHASAGHLSLDGHAVTRGFAVGLRASRLAGEAVQNFEAFGRIDARVSGSLDVPVARARIAIDWMSATVPALGGRPVVSEGGRIAVESRGGEVAVTDVDLPVRGEAHGISNSGVHVDDATFALRIAGAPGRHLTLAGDVEVLGGRVNAAAARSGGRAAAGASPRRAQPWMRPEVEDAALNVRLHSRPGAVVVDVPHLPDLRVNLDMHVGGTVKRPVITDNHPAPTSTAGSSSAWPASSAEATAAAAVGPIDQSPPLLLRDWARMAASRSCGPSCHMPQSWPPWARARSGAASRVPWSASSATRLVARWTPPPPSMGRGSSWWAHPCCSLPRGTGSGSTWRCVREIRPRCGLAFATATTRPGFIRPTGLPRPGSCRVEGERARTRPQPFVRDSATQDGAYATLYAGRAATARPPGTTFTFAALADAHIEPPAQLPPGSELDGSSWASDEMTLAAVAEDVRKSQPDFVLSLGDQVDYHILGFNATPPDTGYPHRGMLDYRRMLGDALGAPRTSTSSGTGTEKAAATRPPRLRSREASGSCTCPARRPPPIRRAAARPGTTTRSPGGTRCSSCST